MRQFLRELLGKTPPCPICYARTRRFRVQRMGNAVYRLCPSGTWVRLGFKPFHHGHDIKTT